MKKRVGRSVLLAWLSCTALDGQQELRSDDIAAARLQKQQNLEPVEEPQLENVVVRAQQSIAYRLLTSTDGLGIGFGEMVPGAGFAGGLRYQKPFLDDRIRLSGYFGASDKAYYVARFTASVRHLWNDRALVDFSAVHSDYTQMPYYGQGPDSRKTGRSDYRLETTGIELRPTLKPFRHLAVGLVGGFTAYNVGPGTASRYISTDLQFGPGVTPGIQQQSNFLQGGAFVEYDWRNHEGAPTAGGKYRAEYSRLLDRDLNAYSFYRLNLDASHYIPLFNGKRVIALHGETWLSDTNKTQEVPFYLQPTLGGPDSLRGFRPFRFYDNDAVLVQGEYRWEASSILDMALFADGGKVFHNWNQLSLHDIEGSFGFGLRFKTQSKVAFRIDTAFSHEGFQICFRAHNPF